MALTLKAARVNVKLSQKQAAKQLEIAESTLSLYERGVSFPSVPVIKRMEKLYGVDYKDLIFLS